MKRVRVIPILLIRNGGLVKSVKFRNWQYVGDPINAVKIFNDKEVDEIAILDISATPEKRGPDIGLVRTIAAEAFMPLAWGGGIHTLHEVKQLINAGVEKVIINSAAGKNISLITEASNWAGSQSVVASIDVKKNFLGKSRVYIQNGSVSISKDPESFAKEVEDAGAGEILLQDIGRDGSFSGYNLDLVQRVSSAVNVPVIAAGGAGSLDDFRLAVESGASAVAAGSLFVLQRPHRAVLISYPSQDELRKKLFEQINNA